MPACWHNIKLIGFIDMKCFGTRCKGIESLFCPNDENEANEKNMNTMVLLIFIMPHNVPLAAYYNSIECHH